MYPRAQWRPARLPTHRMQAGLVVTAISVSATAHAAAASEAAGGMAWWMAAMAIACLACAAPMVGHRRCTSRAAEHLLGMGIIMILIHLAVLVLPGAGAHHGTAPGGSSHGTVMLALLGVELVCLILASIALRLGRSSPLRQAAQPIPSPTH